MALPFVPETPRSMKKRLPDALQAVFRVKSGNPGVLYIAAPGTRPGELRTHVFDFSNGVRLIVSIDEYDTPNNGPFRHLHVTGSYHVRGLLDPQELQALVLDAWGLISKDPVECFGFTSGGIVHYVAKVVEVEE